jgi:transcriptional regulator with XRE-family HTH domain
MAADRERQEEIGARIKELRGRIPQPVVADAVGVTLRAYQAWEAGDSGIAWPNLVKLAKYFKVSADYLEYGESGRQGPSTQLDRIEAALAELEDKLDVLLERTAQMPNVAVVAAEAAVKEVRRLAASDPPAAVPPGADSTQRSGAKRAARKAPARKNSEA